ncbi:MAG TPA: 30S ribosomal protein S6 [Candidatus Scybalousia intestinigallinarum]|nr:30S ribosomal protein S6 [Candidatus Scybalousia intestinigallinarum]
MKKYEIMFIVKPDLEEENIKKVANSMKETLETNGAKVLEVKEMGQRELAYEIKKYKTGYYFLFVIETENTTATKEFDRLALINENIIRHLIVRVED